MEVGQIEMNHTDLLVCKLLSQIELVHQMVRHWCVLSCQPASIWNYFSEFRLQNFRFLMFDKFLFGFFVQQDWPQVSTENWVGLNKNRHNYCPVDAGFTL